MTDLQQIATAAGSVHERVIAATGTQAQMLILATFLLTFAAVRLVTHALRRRASGGAESSDGLHVHHSAVGIVLLLLTGYVSAGINPDGYGGLVAVLFGVGAALTLDEFALWLRLEDVYWTKAGRDSIHAVIIATVGMMLTILWLQTQVDVGAAIGGLADFV